MIVIVGDSWGVGEWDANGHLDGPGFGQYLMKDHAVINLSIPGGSNGMAVDRLAELLERYHPAENDIFYWVVTCPGRDSTHEYFYSSNNLYDSIQSLLHDRLSKADQLAKNSFIKINLIGGLCDLDRINLNQYQNLQVEIPSWCSLLDPDYKTFYFDGAGYWPSVGTYFKSHRPHMIPQWLEIAEHLHQRRISYGRMKKSYMKTDGCHPDRAAHRLLLNQLKINK